jgi:hypothetical protein
MIELSCVDFDGLVSMGLAPESDFKVYFPQSLQAPFGPATISAASPTRTNARRKTAFRPLRQAKHGQLARKGRTIAFPLARGSHSIIAWGICKSLPV